MARVSDQLVETLKHEIQTGILKPGAQLEEAALARRFDVSRTPVREAVRSLVESGLLETRARKGAFVRCLSAKELIDLFEVSAELEGLACRLAAERLTDPAMALIKTGLEACVDAATLNDTKAYAQANLAFHAAIHDASANTWLAHQLAEVETRINPYRSMPYTIRNRVAQSLAEHHGIAEAIFDGNGALAGERMRDHMMLQGRLLPLLLQNVSG